MYLIYLILQVAIAKAVFAQVSPCQCLPFGLANLPLADLIRKTRQINLPSALGTNSPINGFSNNLPLNNGMPVNNLPQNNRLPNKLMNNGMPMMQNFNNLPNSRFMTNNGMIPNNGMMASNGMMPNNGMMNNNAMTNRQPSNMFNGMQNGGLQNTDYCNGFINANNMPMANFNMPPNGMISNYNAMVPGANNMAANNFMPNGNEIPNNNNYQRGFNNMPTSRISELQANNQLVASSLATGSLNNMLLNNFHTGNGMPNMNNLQERNQMVANNLATNSFNNLFQNNMANADLIPNSLQENNQQTASNLLKSNFGNMFPDDVPTSNLDSTINGFSTDPGFPLSNMPNNLPVSQSEILNNFPTSGNSLLNTEYSVASNMPNIGLNFNNLANSGINRDLSPFNNLNNGLNIQYGLPSTNNFLTNTGITMNRLPSNFIQGSSNANNLMYGTPMNVNMPKQEILSGFSLFNSPNECQTGFVSNLNMGNDFANNYLQTEGFCNLPTINGMPVAGITDTISLMNSPYGL